MQKELHHLSSNSLCREHAAPDERKDYTELGPVYKNGDAVLLLPPCQVGIQRFKTWSTPAVLERRIGLNTYDISTQGGQIKAAHSS